VAEAVAATEGTTGRSAVRCRALDGSGAPLAGVEVTFVWRVIDAAGRRSIVAKDRVTTSGVGEARSRRPPVAVPPGARLAVGVVATYHGQTHRRSLEL
jgi:hypothetical protein